MGGKLVIPTLLLVALAMSCSGDDGGTVELVLTEDGSHSWIQFNCLEDQNDCEVGVFVDVLDTSAPDHSVLAEATLHKGHYFGPGVWFVEELDNDDVTSGPQVELHGVHNKQSAFFVYLEKSPGPEELVLSVGTEPYWQLHIVDGAGAEQ